MFFDIDDGFENIAVTAVESGSSALQYLGLDGERSSVGFDDVCINLCIVINLKYIIDVV